MEFIHVRNLEKYHPGYKDRRLKWCKAHTQMLLGDPDFILIENDLDKWRFIGFIMLELELQKPIPNDTRFLQKFFNQLKERPISLTLQVLQKQLEIVTPSLHQRYVEKEEDKIRVDKKERENPTHPPFVFLNEEEYKNLISDFGEPTTKDYIQRLNDYAAQFPDRFRKYKSHVATIRNWLRRDGKNPTYNKYDPLAKYEKKT